MIEECWKKTDKAPVTVRWVDVLKATGIRSRLAARDFKCGDNDRDELFAATPPLERIRLLLSKAATRPRTKTKAKNGGRKLMFIDAKKAHINPKCEEDVYIELPTEAKRGVNQCGKLNFWLYGFRPAAQAWEKFYAEKLEAAGFVRGIGCSVVFYN